MPCATSVQISMRLVFADFNIQVSYDHIELSVVFFFFILQPQCNNLFCFLIDLKPLSTCSFLIWCFVCIISYGKLYQRKDYHSIFQNAFDLLIIMFQLFTIRIFSVQCLCIILYFVGCYLYMLLE